MDPGHSLLNRALIYMGKGLSPTICLFISTFLTVRIFLPIITAYYNAVLLIENILTFTTFLNQQQSFIMHLGPLLKNLGLQNLWQQRYRI